MRSQSLAHTLLSLFATPERAAEIEGDLLEERAARGTAWFVRNILGITLVLFAISCKEYPLRLTLLTTLATIFTVVECVALDRLFFATHALIPSPFFGLLAVALAACTSGCGLAYFGVRLGTRAAACTVILLTVFLVVKYTLADWGVSAVGYLFISVAALPAPFAAGSILGYLLRSRD